MERGNRQGGTWCISLWRRPRSCCLCLRGFLELGKLLDKFYIPTRYVDAWSEGVPFEYFTRGGAEAALAAAEKILAFVEELWKACLDSGRR